MILSNKKISGFFASLIIVIIIALSIVSSCGRKEAILIDGSSTVYPITEAVAEEYRKVAPNVNVTVGISGTGGGFKKFCNGETDISDASRRIKKKEIQKCAKSGIKYLELPVAYDGIAVLVNKENSFVDQLTTEELKKIFQFKNHAKSWRKINNSYPDEMIKIFAPGQDSGTFDYFVEAILGKKQKMRSDATFSEDDNVLVTGIAGEKSSIGFFGLAYYEANRERLKLVAIVNPKTKKAVKPMLDTVKSGIYYPLSRPIFVYISKKARQKQSIFKFVNFYMDKAGELSQDVGYIPLIPSLYKQNRERFAKF